MHDCKNIIDGLYIVRKKKKPELLKTTPHGRSTTSHHLPRNSTKSDPLLPT